MSCVLSTPSARGPTDPQVSSLVLGLGTGAPIRWLGTFASAQLTSWFARLLRMRCASYRCPRRPNGRSWPTIARNPGNVGLDDGVRPRHGGDVGLAAGQLRPPRSPLNQGAAIAIIQICLREGLRAPTILPLPQSELRYTADFREASNCAFHENPEHPEVSRTIIKQPCSATPDSLKGGS